MDAKVIKLIDKNNNTLSWSVKDMLTGILEKINCGEFPQKAVVISLEDDGDFFKVDWEKAGILNSETIAAIEIVKHNLVELLQGD